MLAGLVCYWLGLLDCTLVVMYANAWVPALKVWLFSYGVLYNNDEAYADKGVDSMRA